jgi:hypothetical protein
VCARFPFSCRSCKSPGTRLSSRSHRSLRCTGRSQIDGDKRGCRLHVKRGGARGGTSVKERSPTDLYVATITSQTATRTTAISVRTTASSRCSRTSLVVAPSMLGTVIGASRVPAVIGGAGSRAPQPPVPGRALAAPSRSRARWTASGGKPPTAVPRGYGQVPFRDSRSPASHAATAFPPASRLHFGRKRRKWRLKYLSPTACRALPPDRHNAIPD